MYVNVLVAPGRLMGVVRLGPAMHCQVSRWFLLPCCGPTNCHRAVWGEMCEAQYVSCVRRVSDTFAGGCLGTALVSVCAMAARRLQKGT